MSNTSSVNYKSGHSPRAGFKTSLFICLGAVAAVVTVFVYLKK